MKGHNENHAVQFVKQVNVNKNTAWGFKTPAWKENCVRLLLANKNCHVKSSPRKQLLFPKKRDDRDGWA